MLTPKRTKYRKFQRGRLRGDASRGNRIEFGEFAIQSLEAKHVTERQIEAARRAMTRHIKRGGKVWIRVFPDLSMTKLPAETRMGKGKGNPEFWVARVRRGTIIFELSGVDETIAREALRRAAHKLPIKTKIQVKEQ
jgi:large subunit ribosomal protein L16